MTGAKVDPAAYSKALTNMTDDLDTRLPEEQKAAARRTAANWVVDKVPEEERVEALTNICQALGLMPGQEDESFRTSPMPVVTGGTALPTLG